MTTSFFCLAITVSVLSMILVVLTVAVVMATTPWRPTR